MRACSQSPLSITNHSFTTSFQPLRTGGDLAPTARLLWLGALQACPHQSHPSAKFPVLLVCTNQ